MKLPVYDLDAKKLSDLELPIQFDCEYRPDLILRAFLAYQSHNRKKYGAKLDAGMRHSAKLSRRRRDYRGGYGFGIARVPRKILSRNGRRMHWVGAVAPNTVGGRRAHPPKVAKNFYQKINVKERRKALLSAISSSFLKTCVEERNHIVPDTFPFIVSEKISSVSKTKELKNILATLGLKDELARATIKKIRAGKGKMRGRRYKRKTSVLIVVNEKKGIEKAIRNIPGVEVSIPRELNINLLSPGAHGVRFTLWTDAAIKYFEDSKLFLN
jgi:large subunit ribosomal protein L4e